ncbi:MAG: NPCBM/NEW2 domain-containing protein, partial [Phycisphaerae bacterium]
MKRTVTCLRFSLTIAVLSLRAPDLAPASVPNAPPPFIVQTIDLPDISGHVVAWNSRHGLSVEADSGRSHVLRTADVVRITRPDAPKPGAPIGDDRSTPWEARTIDGERLLGTIVGGSETDLRFALADGNELRIPLDTLTRISATRHEIQQPPVDPTTKRREDEVLLRNGDRAAGIVDLVDQTGVSLQTGRRRRQFDWSVVAAVSLANPNRPSSKPGIRFRCEALNGCIFHADQINWKNDSVELHRTAGDLLSISAAAIASVQVLGGRWQWLGQLEPERYQSIPFMDLTWPLMIDRNALGGALRCGDRIASHGIGLHAAAKVAWDLGGRYERFTTNVCIDDSGGPWSDVHVEFHLDGRLIKR